MREKKPLTTTYRNTKTEYGKKITHGHFIHTHTQRNTHIERVRQRLIRAVSVTEIEIKTRAETAV